MSYNAMMRDKNRVTKRRKPKPSTSGKPTPDMADFDDELLLILLRNMRNAAATFGEGTPPYENIRKVLEDHLNDMKRKGKTTNIAKTRQKLQNTRGLQDSTKREKDSTETVSTPMATLTIRPKPANS